MRRLLFVCNILGLWLFSAAVPAADLPDFRHIAKANAPAIVNISTVRSNGGGEMRRFMPDLPEGSPFDEFFKHFFEGRPRSHGMPEERALGSGFLISEDGYIFTNAHVIKGADKVIVRFADQREHNAEVVGSDPRTDVALLKIEGDDWPKVELGDSDQLEVAEWVMAIGSPFGLEQSVSVGVVSALGRNLPDDTYVPFIQTDVAVNPGNSGGPLFNTRGEVVGINSQIYSKSGGYMGLSFAIPIKLAMQVADQLKTHGRVEHGWLGVLIQNVNQDLAESFGMAKPGGALVAEVTPDSPAARAGVRQGDIIIAYNGTPVKNSADLPPLVGSTPVGSKVPLTVRRGGEKIRLSVTIGRLDADRDGGTVVGERGHSSGEIPRLELTVGTLSQDLRDQYQLPEGGVLVEEVGPGPAAKAGIRRGDVIVQLGRESVEGPAHFVELVADLPADKPVSVLIRRGESSLFLALRVE